MATRLAMYSSQFEQDAWARRQMIGCVWLFSCTPVILNYQVSTEQSRVGKSRQHYESGP